MATISATSSVPRAALLTRAPPTRHSSALGLPSMRVGKVKCKIEKTTEETNKGIGAASLAATTAATAIWSPAAMALVDERLSTEGTGLPFGLSNNLLVWILAGVFALIWALYFAYTSTLEEDDDSALEL